MKSKINLLYSYLIRTLLYFFPDIPQVMRLRGWLYSLAMKSCGRNFQVSASATIKGLHNFSVGNDCYLASGTVISAGLSVTLDDEVLIGYYSILIDGNHSQIGNSYRFGPPVRKPIHIGSGCWVSANVVIVGGVNIGTGCLVGANSIINKNISEPGVYGMDSKVVKIK